MNYHEQLKAQETSCKDLHFDSREVRLRSGKRDRLPKKCQNPTLNQEAIDAIKEYLPYRDSKDKTPWRKVVHSTKNR